jgi:hypothetical protein
MTTPLDDPNVGGPPNTAGMPAVAIDTTDAKAQAALYYDPAGAVAHANAVLAAAAPPAPGPREEPKATRAAKHAADET